jgi:glycosyltransferase involved in cell wall biosynthesis
MKHMLYFDISPAMQPQSSGVQKVIWEVSRELLIQKKGKVVLLAFIPRSLDVAACIPPHFSELIPQIRFIRLPRKVFDFGLPWLWRLGLPIDLFFRDMRYYFSFDWWHLNTRVASGALMFDLTPWIYPKWHTSQNRIVFNRRLAYLTSHVDNLVVISQQTKKDLLSLFPQVRALITVANPGIGTHFSRSYNRKIKLPFILPKNYLLYAGTIEPRKNIHRLIKSYSSLPYSWREKWPLVLVGKVGWDKHFEQSTLKELGIHYLGYVEDRFMEPLYAKSRALIYPSLYEGFGLSIIEAMACGTLVLTSKRGSMLEAGGKIALYVNPESIRSIRDGLLKVTSMAESQRQKKISSGIIWAQSFSYQKMVKKLLASISDSF